MGRVPHEVLLSKSTKSRPNMSEGQTRLKGALVLLYGPMGLGGATLGRCRRAKKPSSDATF